MRARRTVGLDSGSGLTPAYSGHVARGSGHVEMGRSQPMQHLGGRGVAFAMFRAEFLCQEKRLHSWWLSSTTEMTRSSFPHPYYQGVEFRPWQPTLAVVICTVYFLSTSRARNEAAALPHSTLFVGLRSYCCPVSGFNCTLYFMLDPEPSGPGPSNISMRPRRHRRFAAQFAIRDELRCQQPASPEALRRHITPGTLLSEASTTENLPTSRPSSSLDQKQCRPLPVPAQSQRLRRPRAPLAPTSTRPSSKELLVANNG